MRFGGVKVLGICAHLCTATPPSRSNKWAKEACEATHPRRRAANVSHAQRRLSVCRSKMRRQTQEDGNAKVCQRSVTPGVERFVMCDIGKQRARTLSVAWPSFPVISSSHSAARISSWASHHQRAMTASVAMSHASKSFVTGARHDETI